MLVIYNETKTNWMRNEIKGAEFIIKSKSYKKREVGAKKKDASIKLISYTNVLDNDNYKNIQELKLMKQPVQLLAGDTNLLFSKKDMCPIVNKASGQLNVKDIFMVSINLLGRKIIGYSTSMVLDYILLGGEFTLTVAVKPENDLKIYLLDTNTNEKITYTFTKKDGNVFLEITASPYTVDADKEQAAFRPKRFRPASISELVLWDGNIKEFECNALSNYHKVEFLYEDTNLNELLKDLVTAKYRAITYVGSDEKVIEKLKDKFDIIFVSDGNTVTRKVKY